MKKLFIPAIMVAALLAGCAQDPASPRRICILQSTGEQVSDSRCEGAGEPGVTQWYFVPVDDDDDDDDDLFKKSKPKSKTSTKSTTTTRRR